MRTLEAQVGTALLERGSRGSRPTAAGQQLLRVLGPAIRDIDGAVREIRSRGRRPVVRLFTDFGFASFWMMPRMASFRATAPDVEVHIVASAATDPGTADAMDVAVLFGARTDFSPGARQLFPERVVPVCSPAFAKASGILADPGAVAHLPLLHLESTPNPRWFAWRDWLAANGLERRAGSGDLGLNTYGLVVQAAIADQGLALGWSGLVDGALADGTLIEVGAPLVNPDSGYWLIANEPLTAPAEALAGWIRETAAAEAALRG